MHSWYAPSAPCHHDDCKCPHANQNRITTITQALIAGGPQVIHLEFIYNEMERTLGGNLVMRKFLIQFQYFVNEKFAFGHEITKIFRIWEATILQWFILVLRYRGRHILQPEQTVLLTFEWIIPPSAFTVITRANWLVLLLMKPYKGRLEIVNDSLSALWRPGMEILSAYLAFCEGKPTVICGSLS